MPSEEREIRLVGLPIGVDQIDLVFREQVGEPLGLIASAIADLAEAVRELAEAVATSSRRP